jgi:hypothetical protein
MAKYINKKVLIDPESGEILREKSWVGYDGFNEKGYRYRARSTHIRYYFDSLPANFDKDVLLLLFMIAELMNEENVLVYRVKRKSKFSNIIYKPMDKELIRESCRFPFGMNKFDRCWKILTKNGTIKRVRYYNFLVWGVDPSVISKCREIPYWLYDAFQDTINPHLSAVAIKKFQNKLQCLYNGEIDNIF